jgi:hypothetical protein
MILTDDDNDDFEEEGITPQDDDESAMTTEHNLDPAMEQLVDACRCLRATENPQSGSQTSHRTTGTWTCFLYSTCSPLFPLVFCAFNGRRGQ